MSTLEVNPVSADSEDKGLLHDNDVLDGKER